MATLANSTLNPSRTQASLTVAPVPATTAIDLLKLARFLSESHMKEMKYNSCYLKRLLAILLFLWNLSYDRAVWRYDVQAS